jgi:sterol 3beta-glucosyltransferase
MRGDVQPYIALGLGLQAAGHQVHLATSANFESFVRSYGLDFRAISGDIQAMMAADRPRSTMEGKHSLLDGLTTLTRKTREELEQLMTSCWSACEGTEAIHCVGPALERQHHLGWAFPVCAMPCGTGDSIAVY